MIKKVLRTHGEVVEFFKDFGDTFSFDTETTALKYMDLELEGMSFCDGNKACYIDFVDMHQIYLGIPIETVLLLRNLFNNAKLIIAHNIAFDFKVLHKSKIQPPEYTNIYDTMIADHLLDENRPHGLKYLAKELLGKEVISYEEAKRMEGDVFVDYAINDAIFTWELYKLQVPQLQAEGLLPLMCEIEMPFQRCLLDMEINGVLIDKDKVNNHSQKLNCIIQKLIIDMHNEIDEPYEFQMTLDGQFNVQSKINFNSADQLGCILFGKLGLDVIETTPAGKPSAGKATLEKLKNKHPFVCLLDTYKKAQKLLTSFYEPMYKFIDSDGCIRPNFRDIGTKTGRLSCNNPNLQQLAREVEGLPNIRECFIVPKGYKMITCDYSGQELRVLAQLSGAKKMIEAFNSGADFHQQTADAFGVDRYTAKTINFGIAYGKGAFGFANDWSVTEEKAQEILDKYFGSYPEVKQAMEDTHKFLDKNGYVVAMSGRRRRFIKEEWGLPKKAYRQAFNFLIQGFSADMMRKALVKVREYSLRHPHFGLKLLLTVHDEGVWMCKEEYADEVAIKIKDIFENDVCKFKVPVLADAKIGMNYMESK